jgi:hypothetical protein
MAFVTEKSGITITWLVSAGAREAGDEEPLRSAHDPRLHRVHAASPHTGIASRRALYLKSYLDILYCE